MQSYVTLVNYAKPDLKRVGLQKKALVSPICNWMLCLHNRAFPGRHFCLDQEQSALPRLKDNIRNKWLVFLFVLGKAWDVLMEVKSTPRARKIDEEMPGEVHLWLLILLYCQVGLPTKHRWHLNRTVLCWHKVNKDKSLLTRKDHRTWTPDLRLRPSKTKKTSVLANLDQSWYW